MLLPIENGFRIQGEVSFNNVVSLRAAGEKYFSTASANRITIDLSEMKERDASCFSLLLSLMRLAKKRNGHVSVVHASSSLQQMAQMFGIDWVTR